GSHNSEVSMIKKVTIPLLVLVLVVFMAGCSALEMSARSTRKAVALGEFRGINTVKLSRSNVISFGRFSGTDEVEIRKTTEVTAVDLGDRGRIQFLLPANPSSTYFDETREYLERGAGEFSAALSRTLSDYLTMVDVDLDVGVVLASEPCSFYSSHASIRGRLLVSL